ncbi:MAG TPA: NUDIX hydrolase [Patescibacteria group bacterium]|nr:NUDIX hydrolase [Patescibacteria group bacterium]
MTKKRLQAWGDTKIIAIVGAFVYDQDGQLLLLRRHSDDLGGGQWGTPGGRIDPDESPLQAMQREFFEETGVKSPEFTELGVHEVRMPHGAVHITSYRAKLDPQAVVVIDPLEHEAYAWFDPDKLLEADRILWGMPSILRDFGLLNDFAGDDPTLADGSSVKRLS